MEDYDRKLTELKKTLHQASNLRQLDIGTSSKHLHSKTQQGRPKSAKAVECTQNIVQLRKLVNDWNHLEREKISRLHKMEHEQAQYSRFLPIDEHDSSGLHESFEIEPGFRFKANGEIKKPKGRGLTNVADFIPDWEFKKKDFIHKDTISLSSEPTPSHTFVPGAFDSSTKDDGRQSRENDSFLGSVNVTKVIEESEQLLRELNQAQEIHKKAKKKEHTPSTFLRAVSKDGHYSGGPDKVKTLTEMHKACHLKDSEKSLAKSKPVLEEKRFKSNCPACQFNLSVRKDKQSMEKDLEKLQKPSKRWQPFTGAHHSDFPYAGSSEMLKTCKLQKKTRINSKEKNCSDHSNMEHQRAIKYLTKVETRPLSEILHTRSTDIMNKHERKLGEIARESGGDGRASDQRRGDESSASQSGKQQLKAFIRMLSNDPILRGRIMETTDKILKDRVKSGKQYQLSLDLADSEELCSSCEDVAFSERSNYATRGNHSYRDCQTNRTDGHNVNTDVPSIEIMKKRLDLETRESVQKLQEFMDKMPPPSVAIPRWRTGEGVNKSVGDICSRRYTTEPEEDGRTSARRRQDTNTHHRKAELEQIQKSKLMSKACAKTFKPIPAVYTFV